MYGKYDDASKQIVDRYYPIPDGKTFEDTILTNIDGCAIIKHDKMFSGDAIYGYVKNVYNDDVIKFVK